MYEEENEMLVAMSVLAVLTVISLVLMFVGIVKHWACAGWFILAFLVCGIGLITTACIQDHIDNNRVFASCLADGKKEYECHALLDNHYSTVVAPMPVVIGR